MQRLTERDVLQRLPNGGYALGLECAMCHKVQEITVSGSEMFELQTSDKLIQQILPKHSPGQCEMFISRTCDDCWEELFADEVEP